MRAKAGRHQGIPWAQHEGNQAQYINGSSKAAEEKETWKVGTEDTMYKITEGIK